jgi:hypothetical protein
VAALEGARGVVQSALRARRASHRRRLVHRLGVLPCCRPTGDAWPSRRDGLCRWPAGSGGVDLLALRTYVAPRRRLVLVVAGVGVRQPRWLRLLRCLPPARRACMGKWDDLVRQASRALAVGALGEALCAHPGSEQSASPRRAARRPRRSTSPPIAHRAPLSPTPYDAPTRAQHPSSNPPSRPTAKASLPLVVAPLRIAAHSCIC